MEMSVREFAGVLIGLFVSMAIQAQTSLECGYIGVSMSRMQEKLFLSWHQIRCRDVMQELKGDVWQLSL